jgi:6-phosphogluconolactonase
MKNQPSRRDFLKLSAAGALGLSFAKLPFVHAFGTQAEVLLYVGTYTNGKSEGIYRYRVDLASGQLRHAGTTSHVVNPSFLTLSPNRRHLYAVNEVGDFGGRKSGAVSSFTVDPQTGELKLLNQQPSLGADPCYVTVDKTGRFVLVANYTGGNVSVLPIRPDGSLGEAMDMKQDAGSSINRARQEGPHAHCVLLDNSNRYAYSCDLGTDKIMIFRFDNRNGKLQPAQPPWIQAKRGAGPRHLTFHPTGRYVFVMNELDSSITAFARNQTNGSLTALRTLTTLPAGFSGANTGADIHVSSDGQFVYCSNRGHNSIAIFAIGKAGDITAVGHESTRGLTPRNFAIDPTGKFLLVANQKSDNIVVFRRDERTGRLAATGQQVEVPSPVCLKFG